MKTTHIKPLLLTAVVIAALLVTSCTKDDLTQSYIKDLVGTYKGVLVYDIGTQTDSIESTAEVSVYSGTQISFHCFNSVFDTTMILDAFENGDSMNVCLTGNDFSNRYGHHQGERHMGHMSNSQNSWMHHLDDEHQAGDNHYGAFNHNQGTCNFDFLDVDGKDYTFYGARVN